MYTKRLIEKIRRSCASAQSGVTIILIAACTLTALVPRETLAQKKQDASSQSSASKTTAQTAKTTAQTAPRASIPDEVMLRIIRAEDERRWDADISPLLFDKNVAVRRRAALAAGRIGDERALSSLLSLLQTDRDMSVRAMAAFALGEIESATGAEGLLMALRASQSGEVRARALEALGKIAAALPKAEEARARTLGEAISNDLVAEMSRTPQPDRNVILLGLTAVLRARPMNGGAVVARFLGNADARVRADAANTLTRLRAKDGAEQLRALLTSDTDAVVRANAARALGAGEDIASLDALAASSANDRDERVRVSAIRALGSLKDARAAVPLMQRGTALFTSYRATKAAGTNATTRSPEINEILEIATALSRVLANTWDVKTIGWLRELRETEDFSVLEVEIAFARIAPALYVREKPFDKLSDQTVRASIMKDWRRVSSLAQGLGEISAFTAEAAGNSLVGIKADAQLILRSWLDDASLPALAAPDVLRALAAFKSNDLGDVLRKQLLNKDTIMRATAAELLGELPPEEPNTRSLAEALPLAMRDQLNDAALAILDALARQKSATANDVIKMALGSLDHIVRRRAVALLKANGISDLEARVGTVATRNTVADYQRALARTGKRVRATITTDKGAFTIEFLPDDAPLTVDNFIQLAQRGYFNGVTFHRVVPNFVVQGGDPRGDGNGGPGYQIRCEINNVPYDTGAVGMALSGKDTGGSQWFVTHSPQPHLDGGYTVFARVVEGMSVVNNIARGDVIRGITVTEGARAASKP